MRSKDEVLKPAQRGLAWARITGWVYRDTAITEPGQVVELTGEHGDGRLLSLTYLVPLVGDGIPCKVCSCVLASASYLAMHTRRRHQGRPEPPQIRDAAPGELAAHLRRRDDEQRRLAAARAEDNLTAPEGAPAERRFPGRQEV